MLPPNARAEFDRFYDEIVGKFPPDVKKLLETTPIVVEDEPTAEMLEELGIKPTLESELCGLHAAIPLNQKAVWETPVFPGQIHIFRGPIYRIARGSQNTLRRQLEITLLHEIGHHFDIHHNKLKAMGYA
jgi:predicted Zn-dependent protease with MMP-like domain